MQHEFGDDRPVELLGVALMRATGVLAALTACQDAERGKFVVSEPFIMQAVSAIEGFIHEARNAYLELCAEAEMNATTDPAEAAREPAPVAVTEVEDREAFAAAPEVAEAEVASPGTMLPGFYELRRRATFAEHLQRHDKISEADEFAVSYDALLRKLTAAEVFAAEQGLSEEDGDSPLLPLLKSLRLDLERLRSAA